MQRPLPHGGQPTARRGIALEVPYISPTEGTYEVLPERGLPIAMMLQSIEIRAANRGSHDRSSWSLCRFLRDGKGGERATRSGPERHAPRCFEVWLTIR